MSSHHQDAAPGENELERLLKLAVTEPAHRPAFFRELLDATVLILGDSDQVPQDGDVILNADTPINIQHWEKQDGGSIIPFFSSLEALQKAVEDEQPFIALPARVLFEITQGADLFLNPKAEYGKEFYPEEVTMLLATGGVAKPVEHYVDKETQILLGQPEEYPAAMVDALTTLFSQRKPVRRAFLALMHDQAADEKPNLLVGLEVDGEGAEIDALINEAGSVASATAPNDDPVDFCLVSEKERGVSHYLITHTQPFYQRRWGSWLRNIIPSTDKTQ
ncbi:enhanced serine sensitivity protein SseB [Serratia entomophila]|uniref:enhanced serine sensitivity protein SseB n=1 Tax=Serratia entomophila TaxID=42906 RepID=UPI002179BECE|nr:enhanced serine sensitivity protein SseB [Serratia entomophila]CAI1055506.1 enhanced serine sensitivity protein SseB [Serratia entomophila]CAI1084335.1 enhanced serine sensitivity protein SseB [Serratia entomophila]CAI1088071.1 enhanced serine sensitivity protein SseB [Serratia entomophila]CAI1874391.1 enhanced serine sensitivity protein SseB [Serratia entomophila]CAI1881593.1 enhanced serine sensitivity protein SseB [Serratia entomophila]